MDFSSINVLAVLVAALAAFIIGFLWHGPLFGKQWFALMEIPQSKIDEMQAKGMGPMIPNMIGGLVQQIIVALVVSYLVNALGIADAGGAILLALVLWFGFIAAIHLNMVLWENRKLSLYLFNIAYHLATLVAVTLIVTLWR